MITHHLWMLYCNLQVFFCTEIEVEKHFDPRNMTSGGASKNFLGSLSLAIFYGPLVNYAVIRSLDIDPKVTNRSNWLHVSAAKPMRIESDRMGLGSDAVDVVMHPRSMPSVTH